MINCHKYLSTLPFDIYDLTLFSLVVESGSLTRAGAKAQLTQSAMTRRIAAMEEKLGVALFDRTTRRISLTPAGHDFHRRIEPLLAQAFGIATDFSTQSGLRPPELSIGVARSIGLAYLPGFFFAFQREFPEVLLSVNQLDSAEILQALDDGRLDAGLICPPRSLPRGLMSTHRFADDFVLITPPGPPMGPLTLSGAKKLCADQRWLLIKPTGNTGRALRAWLKKADWPVTPAMELDSFDTIVNLVSLGLGVSLVPHRVLPLYERRRNVRRITLRYRFSRQLAVVARKERIQSAPLRDFIARVLF